MSTKRQRSASRGGNTPKDGLYTSSSSSFCKRSQEVGLDRSSGSSSCESSQELSYEIAEAAEKCGEEGKPSGSKKVREEVGTMDDVIKAMDKVNVKETRKSSTSSSSLKTLKKIGINNMENPKNLVMIGPLGIRLLGLVWTRLPAPPPARGLKSSQGRGAGWRAERR